MNLIVNRKACNFHLLKDILQISLLAIMIMNSVAAQNYVVPNKPYRLTDPKPGYLTINEINLGTGLSVGHQILHQERDPCFRTAWIPIGEKNIAFTYK